MLGKQKCLEVLNKALQFSSADQTEAKIVGENFNLTRFANSTIHQNLNRINSELQVRVVFGKKMGTASTNNLDEESIKPKFIILDNLASFTIIGFDVKEIKKSGKLEITPLLPRWINFCNNR